ncbi:MAG: crossover junction endodeoxyribonuclease RuvC [Spirochaetia bacterium]|nr:crossover junction endodeoxyribonuclease RuvC [Spirochaetia bacterium]
MLYLGIDPGYGRMGYGLIKQTPKAGKPEFIDAGVVETASNLPIGERLEIIEKKTAELLKKKKIFACAVEEVFFKKNLTTGVKLLQARGVIILTLHKKNIPLIEISPTSMKKMITGYGAADKRQMQKMIARILGLSSMPKPDDAADALGLAICSWLRTKNNRLK